MKERKEIFLKIRFILIFFIIIVFIFSCIFSVIICNAKKEKILNVGGSGIGNYSTITDAIDNSNDSDTIIIYEGIYIENFIINKSINLIGVDKRNVKIEGNKGLYGIMIRSDYINITGLTISNCKTAILFSGPNYSYVKIYNNIIENNFEGIRIQNSSYNHIFNNTIKNHNDFGIVLYESAYNKIFNNSLINNLNGITLKRWSNLNNIFNNFISQSRDYCVFFGHSYHNYFYYNNLTESKRGIYLYRSEINNITNNSIEFIEDYGIYLKESLDNEIFSNNFFENNQDIKEVAKPPLVKLPNFEFFLIVCGFIFFISFILKLKIIREK
jgi:parallel beta-helix repeat protein